MWFDSHCHLDEVSAGEVDDARRAGVGFWICPAVRGAPRHAGALAHSSPDFAYLVGVHPLFLNDFDEQTLVGMEHTLRAEPRCAGVGEIGLDYSRPDCTETVRARQRDALQSQLALAARLDLPVSVHLRGGSQDFHSIARRFPSLRFVMHAYSGSAEFALRLLRDLPHVFFSFGASTARPGARRGPAALRAVPPDRVLVESDAPYMGARPTSPAALPRIGAALAEIHGTDLEEFRDLTTRNARSVFRWNTDSNGSSRS